MREHQQNTPKNVLPKGINDADVAEAISLSGYPLQAVAANVIRECFRRSGFLGSIQEEWAYSDKEENQLRSVDLLAELSLYDASKGEIRVRPHLDLIVECKLSLMPYVFFLQNQPPHAPDFPMFAGLFTDSVVLSTDDDVSTMTVRIPHALGLESHSFLRDQMGSAQTFSKCVRKGAAIELSGAESFHSLVLPLSKAVQHFQVARTPPKTAVYFDCYLTIAVAVVDAPMIGVTITAGSHEELLLPWVRVFRHECEPDAERYRRDRLFAIDVVHKDFLGQYLDAHVLPFATDFADRTIRHARVLADGQGFVKGMGKDWHSSIEPRLQARTVGAKVTRGKLILGNVSKLLKKETPG